jgi:peptide/nickel transport system substrate-binding protein
MSRLHRRLPHLLSLLLLVALLAGCVAPPAETQPPPTSDAGLQPTAPAAASPTTAAAAPTTAPDATEPAAPTAPAGDKTLTIAMSQEPRGFGVLTSQIAAIEVEQSLNAYFTYRDAGLSVQPWLVEKVPSIADGDWVVNDDGTMEVTWTLREGITWHDGTPMTVEDVIFGWEVMVSPDVPAFGKGEAQLIDRIEKLDERSYRVYWSVPYVFANQGLPSLGTTARPLPRHVLEDIFNTDVEAFRNHPYWTTEFIGTGPYKIVEWVLGSHIVLEAHDDYFLGRPNIDRLIWRFFSNTDTLMANVLSGEVDVTVIPALSIEQAQTVRQEWATSGQGEVLTVPGHGWDWIALNNLEDEKFLDVNVRKALLYALDREAMAEVLLGDADLVAHSWMSPVHPLLTPAVQATMVRYEYDPDLALELMAEAGWTPGPGGVLTNAAGQPFTVSIRTVAGDKLKESTQAIVADYWTQIGVQVETDNQPSQIIFDSAHLFRFGWPSAFLFNFGGNPNLLAGQYRCQDIPNEANSWSGSNLGAYCNEDYDAAYAEQDINSTLDVAEREAIVAKLMPIWTDTLPFLPLYFKPEVATVRTGVTGVTPSGTNEGWLFNVHEWDINR